MNGTKSPERVYVSFSPAGYGPDGFGLVECSFGERNGDADLYISAAALQQMCEELRRMIDSLKVLGVTDTRQFEWCANELGELLEGGK